MHTNLKQAKHNEKFLSELEKSFPDTFYDWKITVLFYTAVHYVDAYLASHKITVQSHKERHHCLEFGEHCMLQDFIDNYRALFQLSHDSRYHGIWDTESFNDYYSEKLIEAKGYLKFVKDCITDDLAQIS